MKLVEVIPIVRGVGADTLTYFTSLPIEAGALVSVPLRKKLVPALALYVRELGGAKTEVKSLDFEMRKIDSVLAPAFFSHAFMLAAKRAADFFACSIGAVLHALAPQEILKSAGENEIIQSAESERASSSEKPARKYALQIVPEERVRAYKSVVREHFAAGRSVFLLVPTSDDAGRMKALLEKGIEQYCFALHSSMTPKKFREEWRKALGEKHSVLVVGTASSLSLPRRDWGAFVVERELSRAYKIQTRPYMDIRNVTEFLAEEYRSDLLLGDTLLRTETLARVADRALTPFQDIIWHPFFYAQASLVDLRKKPEQQDAPFRALSPELLALAKGTITSGEHLFVFAARRGYAPTTVCRDCGETVLCANCSAPAVLHTSEQEGGNSFDCHRCGAKRSAKEVCTKCGSWRLLPLGIGIEKVAEELKEAYSDAIILTLDADTAKTKKQADAILKQFSDTPGAILVGTELALIRMQSPVEDVAIASLDSLFLIPDFRIRERIMSIIIACRLLAKERFLLQTRMPDEETLRGAVRGDLKTFHEAELAERKLFGYPPFAMLVKISATGEKERVKAELDKVKMIFEGEELYLFSAFIPRVRGTYTMHALLKVAPDRWPDKNLLDKLRSLPPYFSVRVDPENLL